MSIYDKSSELFPLTLTQQDIYFDQMYHDAHPIYNFGGYIQLPKVDIDQLTRAHEAMFSSHDAFGLRIVNNHDGIRQYISDDRTTLLHVIDFSQELEPEQKAKQWLNTLFDTVLPIEDSELYQAHLLKVSDDVYYYVCLAHHLIMDGWGGANLAESVGKYYQCLTRDNVEVPWCQIVEKEQRYLKSKRYLRDQEYWQKQLQDFPEPILSPRYLQKYSHLALIPSKKKSIPIEADRHYALVERSRRLGIPVSQLYLALVSIYFSQVNGVVDLVIGTPVHNRSNNIEKEMVGCLLV